MAETPETILCPYCGSVQMSAQRCNACGGRFDEHSRLATQIATVLRGRHKPIYTPHVDVGDFVVVINASKVHVTGKKRDAKKYYNYSGYPGGLRAWTFDELMTRDPKRVIEHAVRGMLPKNRLARKQITKLKVYGGADHPHTAQAPESLAN